MDRTHRGELRPGGLSRGQHRWPDAVAGQELGEAEVVVAADTAVLRTVVTDTVERGDGVEVFRMPMTQVWVRSGGGWRCLAGHAGPRLTT